MVRRTKEEAAATRDSILDAAEILFAKNGVSRTTLQHIATAAGVTRGAIYWHFVDKGRWMPP
jgi:TetR/AcrR family acrAB operon transcriptional repressor